MADHGFTVTIPNLFTLFRPTQAEDTDNDSTGTEAVIAEVNYRNEFSKLSYEFISDIEFFRDKYPLVSLITVVAFAIFAISSFFSFSFVGCISAALYGTVSLSLAKGIGKKGGPFWSSVTASIGQLLQSFALGSKTES